MQKTYWWRVLILASSMAGLIAGYIVFYPYRVGVCASTEGVCWLSSLKKTFAEPLFLLSFFASIVSLFLFFVRDDVFLKWLRFALIWFVVTVIGIALAPVSTGGWMSFGPTKELVSLWMGGLFVFVSFVKLVWDSKKTA